MLTGQNEWAKNKNVFKKIILSIFFLLITGLLIGQRFNFAWAGGQGFFYNLPVKIINLSGTSKINRLGSVKPAKKGDLIARGEIIKTATNSRILLDIKGIKIALDQRTDLKISTLNNDQIELFLSRGRIIINQPKQTPALNILTKHSKIKINSGLTSLINYDFKETIAIMPINSEFSLFLENYPELKNQTEALEIHEVYPIILSPITFNLNDNQAVSFYQWFKLENKLLIY